ncbi:hypothetical protein PVAP13_9NG422514 [Panicum virgatum]|uniref:Uncharacterized protein n=1 Tax=Panicum virgatum TaxID=38727 RepID=A0A8T0MSF0_PANVG|nr:hypothetical protein PVAP13_9NG422514 [Panicum virgatum]
MTCAASSNTCRGYISRGIQGNLLVQRLLTSFHYTIHKTYIQILLSNADQSDKTQGSMTLGMAVDCRKKHNHPVVPRS